MNRGRRLPIGLALLLLAGPAAAADLRERLAEGFQRFDRQDMASARAVFTEALATARQEDDAWALAEAARGLGRVHYRTGRYAEAEAALSQALDGFLALDDRLGAARCVSHLASLAAALGRTDDARGAWLDALPELSALGARREEAEALYNLAIIAPSTREQRMYLERGAQVAAAVGLAQLEGSFQNAWGDLEHDSGNYGVAQDHLEQAARLFEESGSKGDLARVYNSLSRLERVHQRVEEAIALDEKALALQEETEDLQGAMQSLDHLADAYGDLGRHRRALALYDRALALARRTGSAHDVDYVRGRTADAYIRQGACAPAVRLLESVLAAGNTPENRSTWLMRLSNCYVHLGRAREGLAAAEQALELARPSGRRDLLLPGLRMRAHARAALGRLTEANADLAEEISILEEVRGRLAPRDFLKRGFAEQYKSTFAQAVTLLDRAGQRGEALEAAERARARAFVDLLAARRTEGGAGGTGTGAARAGAADDALASPANARAATLDGIRATARRLDTTVVSYFVSDDDTFIWVVDARGLRAATRRPLGARALGRLVADAAPDVEPAPPTARPARPLQVASRGGGLALTDLRVRTALRRLYMELVAPVKSALPRRRGARLTLVPHGPLVRLPFAALLAPDGRYLLESYTLHEAPSAAVLEFTGAEKGRAQPSGPALFVADPSRFPSARPALAALPATRAEVLESSAAVRPAASALLLGAEATEANVRRRAAEASLLHFATHAVVRDDEPFESFLALQPGAGVDDDDGRLTAGEVQGLALHARLVVLSACRTARGPLGADGIVGLARAFFAAGASSVVATLWDVPDGPSARIMSAFYRGLAAPGGRDRALRAAQLGVLRALRQGRLTVPFAGRAVVLPEHPALWAGFVLLGEP